jgi:5'-AMP-activated protein kinase regulatory gamma subunit
MSHIYGTVQIGLTRQKAVRNGAHTALDLTIAEALEHRSVDFEGVVTCSPADSLASIFSLIKIRRVHRLIVVAGKEEPNPGSLLGIISLSDIMRALMVGFDCVDFGAS